MEAREIKGLEIAARSRLIREGELWLVPSQVGKGKYVVDAEAKQCTCPDFEARQQTCKHLFAVSFTLQREYADDGQTKTLTETLVIKKTYRQAWSNYNKAQRCEKEKFVELLAELCKGVEEPEQKMGRPRLPLGDIIFASAFKVYSSVSGRRFMSDLRDAQNKGYLSKAAHYNSISRYLENATLTPLLKALIEASSLPLQAVESDFAVDSSGFSTCRFYQWVDAKYSNKGLMTKRDWVKVHLMVGTKTNIVTAVEVTDRFAADSNYFKPLVDATAQNFAMQEVSADKAYSSAANLQTVVDHHAMPYIPFKSNTAPATTIGLRPQQVYGRKQNIKQRGTLWKQMFHYFSFNQEWFFQQYHKRSNVESTFSMIKAKFGDSLRSRTETAQINEALCKVLCHNICCLIQSIFEFGIDPTFWAVSPESPS